MIRKVVLALAAALLAVSALSCSCAAEKGAVGRLQDQQEKIFSKYSVYVGSDPKLDAKAKDDELKLLQSLRDITSALKRSLGD